MVRGGRAFGLGALAAIGSGVVWWGIRAATGYEIGLIAIVVGLAVGVAVRAGGRNMGGWFYQLLAMLLTYVAITSTYIPEIMTGLQSPPPAVTDTVGEAPPAEPVVDIPAPIRFVIAAVLSLVAPFLMGFENIIGIILIGIALWEAWRVNKRPFKRITGPFTIGAPRGP
jgi:hypothetical protein